MELGIIGLGHAFHKQYKALKQSKYFSKITLCDKKKLFVLKDYHQLKSPTILISTSPSNHLQIVKDFKNHSIILEKPMVKNLSELKELKKELKHSKIFSSLHFAYGKEIDYFIDHFDTSEKPIKIYCYIADKYIKNGHIKKQQIGLGGAYLDETINPLSAVCRIFGYDLKFIDNQKKTYPLDSCDYYALSNFTVNDIPLQIEVNWNTNHNSKFIELIYEDKVIILDSMQQQIRYNYKIIYQAKKDRMTNHYAGVFQSFIRGENNIEQSIKMHEELLKGI